jgi:hypothetical protein
MKDRCRRPAYPHYRHYGGRGIGVCSRWLNGEPGISGFACFLADMGERPSVHHSLDRIDTNGNYEPSNCRWATRSEQNRNTRRNVMVVLNGRTMTMAEAIEIGGSGAHASEIARLVRRGVPVEVAVEGPTSAAYSDWLMRQEFSNLDEIVALVNSGAQPLAVIDELNRLIADARAA